MKKLKEILDGFGWENVQRGELPPEIMVVGDKFEEVKEGIIHQWDLYALKGVFVIVEDGKKIVELSGITKYPKGYTRTAEIPMNTAVKVDNIEEFLEGFKHLHSFKNQFFYGEQAMGFNDLGRIVENAGELYRS